MHLKPNGIAYLATKRFYFGVGGGTLTFQNLMNEYPEFEMEIIQSFEDGKSNIRDLLVIKYRS